MLCVCSTSSAAEDENVHILSEEEMNKLGAKIVKAELMGNMVRKAQGLNIFKSYLHSHAPLLLFTLLGTQETCAV